MNESNPLDEVIPALPALLDNPNAPQEFLLRFGQLHSLTLDQHKVLAALLEHSTITEALQFAGVSAGRRRTWLRTDPKYAEAERLIGAGILAEARAHLDQLSLPAAQAFDDALQAERRINVVCPACEHEFYVAVADQKLRVDVAKEIFKRSGDLTPKAKLEVEHKVRDMSVEDRIAVAQIERAVRLGEPMPVPPDVLRSLQSRGLLPDDLSSAARTFNRGESTEPQHPALAAPA